MILNSNKLKLVLPATSYLGAMVGLISMVSALDNLYCIKMIYDYTFGALLIGNVVAILSGGKTKVEWD